MTQDALVNYVEREIASRARTDAHGAMTNVYFVDVPKDLLPGVMVPTIAHEVLDDPISLGSFLNTQKQKVNSQYQRVAVKIPNLGSTEHQRTVAYASIQREAYWTNKFADNSHVPNLLAQRERRGKLDLIVQEYAGESNFPLTGIRASRSVGDIAKRMADVASVLADLEQMDVYHQDVKPANIFTLPNGGKTFLGDWGVTVNADEALRYFERKKAFGTPIYFSPAKRGLWNGIFDGDLMSLVQQTDRYALGKTMEHLLIGRIKNEDPNETRARIDEIESSSSAGRRIFEVVRELVNYHDASWEDAVNELRDIGCQTTSSYRPIDLIEQTPSVSSSRFPIPPASVAPGVDREASSVAD